MGGSSARAVNDEGVIGGTARDGQGVPKPLPWIAGVPYGLPTLGGRRAHETSPSVRISATVREIFDELVR